MFLFRFPSAGFSVSAGFQPNTLAMKSVISSCTMCISATGDKDCYEKMCQHCTGAGIKEAVHHGHIACKYRK